MALAKEIGLPVDESYPPPAWIRDGAVIKSREQYQAMYDRSVNDRDAFWSELANEQLEWMEPFHTVCDEDLRTGKVGWFLGGKLNVSVNCLDRHLATSGDKSALILEGDHPGEVRSMTYREVYEETCRMA